MYPPHLCGLMEPSSTGRWLGYSLLVIQPSSVLPSKSRSQPAFFSASVSSLSAARVRLAIERLPARARTAAIRTSRLRITDVTSSFDRTRETTRFEVYGTGTARSTKHAYRGVILRG